ncbi:FAD-dependent oxidoreductase [Conexibacter woesei]|uniref:FAD dependent oxidoreductase n=1 Tax=Conexibacter woesei (strain DSM 14684 / CCUG 47730 / CIP 108061 / JCM 11494 / NBRC 100937 / ID131577) TaxID=469383 RepID=D3F9X4_CONWI|nr:FAD-dependent oxidoreductase [Conexibacter woesei]ADB53069.1 FAD dependent oxidoreductase [Conexibacter woesei DSM 14684]
MADTSEITVVGGGVTGLVASIACAEQGASVRLLERHAALGGRGRSTDGPYRANFGPHVLYANGTLFPWLKERGLLPPLARPPLGGVRFRVGGAARRLPPTALASAVARLWRVREAPHDLDFRSWASGRVGERGAQLLARSAGVYCFHHDPGELSAAFVWARWRQAFVNPTLKARYVTGGWSSLIAALDAGARERGVRIETGTAVHELPPGPAIVATELPDARRLLGDETLHWPSGATVALDLGLRRRRGEPFVVWDLDEAGWIERFTAPDPTLAPDGEELVQAQLPLRPGESADDAERRLEALLDTGLGSGWRERVTFRRRMTLVARSGALDPPGTTWRDRPAIDRGGGIFLAGDAVAAPGLLSDPAATSALEAARGALAWAGHAPGSAAPGAAAPGAAAQPAGLRAETSRL